jgi:dipeptidase E
MTRFLLMSSSKRENLGYLEHAGGQLARLFDGHVKEVTLIPYASVRASFDALEAIVAAPFARLGMKIRSVHHAADPARAIREAEAIAVAGGNTFALLKRIHDNGLLDPVRERVAAGVPYVGWSAGSNVACPTIRTANDMAIVMPPSFDAFGLVPFQINPHFIPGRPPGHNMETREERLLEFMTINPGETVVALAEGTALMCEDGTAEVLGDRGALHLTLADTIAWPEGHRCRLDSVNPPAAGPAFIDRDSRGR